MKIVFFISFLLIFEINSYSQILKQDKKNNEKYTLIEFKDSISEIHPYFLPIKTITIDSISNQLEDLFQKSFDSTIVFYSRSTFGVNYESDYFFFGKKNDSIFYYRYFSPIEESKKRRFGPKGSLIDELYFNKKIIFNNVPIYYNLTLDDKFFFIYSEPLKKSLWERIQNDNLWNLNENEDEIKKQSVEETSDGPFYTYRLITKVEVRKLYLYTPEDYPISNIFHLRNRLSDVTKWIRDFYSNHKLELKKL